MFPSAFPRVSIGNSSVRTAAPTLIPLFFPLSLWRWFAPQFPAAAVVAHSQPTENAAAAAALMLRTARSIGQ